MAGAGARGAGAAMAAATKQGQHDSSGISISITVIMAVFGQRGEFAAPLGGRRGKPTVGFTRLQPHKQVQEDAHQTSKGMVGRAADRQIGLGQPVAGGRGGGRCLWKGWFAEQG
ncbi:hypothetical protein COCVIDRAFT_33559 [Bipolaris victoriae FI3]|uniref:Uncharacterized protein n=1 Tax=Bipolaris victoriae (strain FI3) TaxID=930091 RepID=W7EUZ1_BIPV3|nr:hypothetical protein COCVIDRAFT_33559 [Bipolaris victoriae FI3]